MLSRLDNIMSRARDYIAPIAINNYDTVELTVEAERYARHGIHKGDIGCVIDNDAVGNYIEVDFPELTKMAIITVAVSASISKI